MPDGDTQPAGDGMQTPPGPASTPAMLPASVAFVPALPGTVAAAEQVQAAQGQVRLSVPASQVPVILVRNLAKSYQVGQTRVRALRGVSLAVLRGEFVAVMGPSGSGKTTFMNLIGCLDRPSGGDYWLVGRPVSSMDADELADVRNRRIGFVFQGFNLLTRATALKNVTLPLLYAGLSRKEQEVRARRALEMVGLGGRTQHRPTQLSGGQQQRVAIARALVNSPSLLLADEPTGNLDSHTSVEIMAVLQALNERGLTIVLVTHEADIAAYSKRQVVFRDGRVVRDEPVTARHSAQDELMVLAEANARAHNIQIREETP